MKKALILFIIFTLTSCSKQPVVELPITTSSPKALEYYIKAMLSEEVGDGFGPCPLCSEITTRDKIWENSYAFTSVTPNTYTSTVSVFDHY